MKLKPQPGTDLLELKKMTSRMRDRWKKFFQKLYFCVFVLELKMTRKMRVRESTVPKMVPI